MGDGHPCPVLTYALETLTLNMKDLRALRYCCGASMQRMCATKRWINETWLDLAHLLLPQWPACSSLQK